MPKRTNDFQKLIYLVRVNLADGAVVTESKMLTDRVSDKPVEVDVCIEGSVGGEPVMLCIECQDRSRVAGPSWVNEMKAKHERLPTNALILASRRGFTSAARHVAAGYGIQTCSIADVEEMNFPALLGSASTLWTKVLTMTAEKVTVSVAKTAEMEAERVAVMPDNGIFSAEGIERGPVSAIVEALLNSPQALKYFLSEGTEEHGWFTLEWAPPQDHLDRSYYLQRIEPTSVLREITSIKIVGPASSEFPRSVCSEGSSETSTWPGARPQYLAGMPYS
jgi:hypothetical protein